MSERCIAGRMFRHTPFPDDPELETDVGPCPDWPGCGCHDDLPEQRDGARDPWHSPYKPVELDPNGPEFDDFVPF